MCLFLMYGGRFPQVLRNLVKQCCLYNITSVLKVVYMMRDFVTILSIKLLFLFCLCVLVICNCYTLKSSISM